MGPSNPQSPPQSQSPIPLHPRQGVFRFKFHGKGMDLATIVIKNAFLSAVTLGIYNFWGKVNIRKFMWHNAEFHGQRFTYHGTGGELFKGFLKVMGILILAQLLLGTIYPLLPQSLALLGKVGLGLIIVYLFAYVRYASQRYLFSRTSWRGIYLAMHPNSNEYVKTFLVGYILTALTLGLYFPIWQNKVYRIRTNNSRVGTLQMRYVGSDKDAFKIFLGDLPFIIMTLGIYFVWYQAKVSQFRAQRTWLGDPQLGAAKGSLNLSGGELFSLYLKNIVFLLVTFGLAMPWILANNLGFFLSRFSFSGDLKIDQIRQAPTRGSASADSMASLADVGIGL